MKVRLKQAFDLQMGKTPARNQSEYWGGNHKWVSIADIGNAGKYISKTKECITDAGVSGSGIKVVPQGTVIMSFKLSIGKTAITAQDMYTNEAIMAFIDKGVFAIDPNYLYHLCCGTDWTAGTNKAVMGLTLNKATLLEKEISIPDILEQREIAAKLDKIDEIIADRQIQLELIEQAVKSRFIELFGDPETNPYNLDVGKLSDVADIYLGLTHTPTYVEQGKPFLSVRDISSGMIDFSNCHYITEEEFCSLPNGARPKVGDMLFCRVGTIGKPVIIPENTPEFGTFVSVGFLRKKANVNNYYLKSWMENDYFMRQVYDNVAGASQINLNTGWLKNFRILIPSMKLQEQFAAFVEQTDKSKYYSAIMYRKSGEPYCQSEKKLICIYKIFSRCSIWFPTTYRTV